MGKIEKFIWNKFTKVFTQIPGTSRSYRHINKSGFRVDITKPFLHRELKRNRSCREMFFNPKIYSQVFRTNPIYFFHYLPFYFRLNKNGNEVFSKWIEIYQKIA